MDPTIKQVFKTNIQLLTQAEKVVYYFRVQNFDAALRQTSALLTLLDEELNLLANSEYIHKIGPNLNIQLLTDIIRELLKAQENKDYILLADLYTLQVIPFFYDLQMALQASGEPLQDDYLALNLNRIRHTDPRLSMLLEALPEQEDIQQKGYFIEPTTSGLMTLAVLSGNKKYYLHSNHNPSFEAFQLAHSWYGNSSNKYMVYGLGLGYHILELAKMEDSIHIEVYESDLRVIKAACIYSDLSFLDSNPNITIYYDPDFTGLSKRINDTDETMGFFLHHPSLRNINNDTIREKFENLIIQNNAVNSQRHTLSANFDSNISRYDYPMDVLKDKFQGKDLFIVAAGPSLDHNFMQLKNVKDDAVVLATGTVFRKLIAAGIDPDYVIVTDPNNRVYGQIAGLEQNGVPMLCLSTAYFGFASWYKGKKYLICQEGYPKAEEYAREKGLHLFRTGGSVSTTALDIGITFGCKRIIFLGLDLAYTDNLAHASDTSRRFAAETADMRQVEDIHGKLIPTGRNLDIFRVWIENRIRDVKGIEFIDATEGGAKIHGMRIATLEEVLKEL